jgi:hypothetical protein
MTEAGLYELTRRENAYSSSGRRRLYAPGAGALEALCADAVDGCPRALADLGDCLVNGAGRTRPRPTPETMAAGRHLIEYAAARGDPYGTFLRAEMDAAPPSGSKPCLRRAARGFFRAHALGYNPHGTFAAARLAAHYAHLAPRGRRESAVLRFLRRTSEKDLIRRLRRAEARREGAAIARSAPPPGPGTPPPAAPPAEPHEHARRPQCP